MTPPNILWYCTDQQRFDTIRALGCELAQTPTLDALVADGTAFERAYCQSPICTPSRASFLTGLYPGRVHNTRNGNGSFPAWPPLVTKHLADAGYDCGLVGKFHLQSAARRTEPRIPHDGYCYWKFSHAPRDDWREGHDYADWMRERGAVLGDFHGDPMDIPPALHQTAWATERSIEFIQSRPAGRPWMLTVNVFDPHPPFTPPHEYFKRFDPAAMPGPHFRPSDLEAQKRLAGVDFQGGAQSPEERGMKTIQAKYWAMVAQIDDQFGRLLRYLDECGLRDNTVVIFTSDHGEAMGDHGLLQKGCRFYEGLTRVPLIFSWPGRIQRGVRAGALVELLDLTATVFDLAGLAQPDYMQGKSLWPILTGAAPAERHRDFVRCEYFDALAEPNGSFGTMIRNERHKLCVYHGHGLGELFDLANDPWEFENLWDDPGHRDLKLELLHASFDAAMLTGVDVGSPRVARF